MDYTAREVLLALSVKHKGDWNKIYRDILRKVPLKDEEVIEAKEKVKCPYITILDNEYPSALKDSYSPPFLIYYYGNYSLLESPYALTAVGSRKPSLYQSDTTARLVRETEAKLENKVLLVSGMAKGIDQAAMKAAMASEAPVCAVLGSGIDIPYPKDNGGIYEYCKSEKGIVLSEYPEGTEARPDHFVMRNRISVALSRVLFVGGGSNRSGTMASVRRATECNREICALPCDITGDDITNSLIQDGADSILCSDDLVDLLKDRYRRL